MHNQSDNSDQPGLLHYAVVVAAVVLLSVVIFHFLLGTSMRAIESGSMEPNMRVGDIVIIRDVPRFGIVTYQDGAISGYESFGEFGDVVLYRKYGRNGETPIIHRAMYYVDAGEPMWDEGPPAPHAGYITRGDNNAYSDQYCKICREPVREEWVIGVARFRVPYAGYVRFVCLRILGG
ncbi:MAG: signal peptidase I [Desulfuromonadales bacterium C00003107]|jgi:signal peptidase|nr:MAG: signal peptidase I [Desulfuromonadales bacterium C00003107]